MKLLPHYFKWIGLSLFFLGLLVNSIDDGRVSFIEGYNLSSKDPVEINITRVFPEYVMHLSDVVSIVGLLFYFISKSKREDEFMEKLRNETAYLVLTLSIIVLLLFYVFNKNLKFDPSTIIQLQMIFFLIIRAFKRKRILDEI